MKPPKHMAKLHKMAEMLLHLRAAELAAERAARAELERQINALDVTGDDADLVLMQQRLSYEQWAAPRRKALAQQIIKQDKKCATHHALARRAFGRTQFLSHIEHVTALKPKQDDEDT